MRILFVLLVLAQAATPAPPAPAPAPAATLAAAQARIAANDFEGAAKILDAIYSIAATWALAGNADKGFEWLQKAPRWERCSCRCPATSTATASTTCMPRTG